MRTLAISPGWNENPAKRIHSLAPLMVVPTNTGSSSSSRPAIMIVYL